MKKLFLVISLLLGACVNVEALVINEIMSNPVGDDGGREWIEIYNNSSSTVDISNLSISIKGAAAIAAFPLSGGTSLAPNGYAIIGSVVSGTTKFSQDYSEYNGPLYKSSISLVNTGVTSIELKINGMSADILSSYTAAKEGLTLSRVSGSFVSGNPTPGADNQVASEDGQINHTTVTASTTTATQSTIAQASAPLADIVLYLPQEKIAVAGAATLFTVFGLTRGGKQIENLAYTWAYGDGGQSVGSSTEYRYAYPGRYVATVEGGNGYVLGSGRVVVKVVAPDIVIRSIGSGKYGSYVDIENPNPYELDLSQWRLVIDGASFLFPKNTFLLPNNITHISGLAMGFASTTMNDHTSVKIVFPNLEEVVRYIPHETNELQLHKQEVYGLVTEGVSTATSSSLVKRSVGNVNILRTKSKTGSAAQALHISKSTTSTSFDHVQKVGQKDTRIVTFFRSIFSRTN